MKKEPAPLSVRIPVKSIAQLQSIADTQGINRNRMIAGVLRDFIAQQTSNDQAKA